MQPHNIREAGFFTKDWGIWGFQKQVQFLINRITEQFYILAEFILNGAEKAAECLDGVPDRV